MKVALVAGPGGTGVTTVAAATAQAAAADGRRTVLVTADPAIDLILAEVPDTLRVHRVDPRSRGERAWPAISGYLGGLGVGDGLDPAELAGLPGTATVATLLDIAAVARSETCDALVVDAGSDPVGLVSLVESVGLLSDRLLPAPVKLLRQWGGLFGRRGERTDSSEPGSDLLGDLLGRLLLAQAVLTDPRICAAHLVTTDESLRRRATRALVPALALFGVGLGRVVRNRSTGPADPGDWPAEVVAVPTAAGEPLGAGLAAVAGPLSAGTDPMTTEPGPALIDPAVGRVDGGYRMDIPLPLADRDTLDLARAGDDVLITVAGHTRRMELPSVLRRCRVESAGFAEHTLSVTFRPDPDSWPQALASSLPGGGSADG